MSKETPSITIKEVEHLLRSLQWAKDNGLELEYLVSFLEDFRSTGSVMEAVWFAECEWDL